MNDFEFTLGGNTYGNEPVYKIAHYIPMSSEMLAELPGQGWRRADRNPMPRFDLFPHTTRLVRRARFLRYRLGEVIDVARHGIPVQEDEW